MEHPQCQEQDKLAVLNHLYIHEPQTVSAYSGARETANLPAHRLHLPVGGLQQLVADS